MAKEVKINIPEHVEERIFRPDSDGSVKGFLDSISGLELESNGLLFFAVQPDVVRGLSESEYQEGLRILPIQLDTITNGITRVAASADEKDVLKGFDIVTNNLLLVAQMPFRTDNLKSHVVRRKYERSWEQSGNEENYGKVRETLAAGTNLRNITTYVEFLEELTDHHLPNELNGKKKALFSNLLAENFDKLDPFAKYQAAQESIRFMYEAVGYFASRNL